MKYNSFMSFGAHMQRSTAHVLNVLKQFYFTHGYLILNVESNLARGRIADLSFLAVAYAFTHSPATACEQCAMHSCIGTLLGPDMSLLKVPLSLRAIWTPSNTYGFLDPLQSVLQTVSRSVQPLLHSSPVCPTHIHTDHATCDIYGLREGDAA